MIPLSKQQIKIVVVLIDQTIGAKIYGNGFEPPEVKAFDDCLI